MNGYAIEGVIVKKLRPPMARGRSSNTEYRSQMRKLAKKSFVFLIDDGVYHFLVRACTPLKPLALVLC